MIPLNTFLHFKVCLKFVICFIHIFQQISSKTFFQFSFKHILNTLLGVYYTFWKRLFTGRVPVNKEHLTGTVPVNKEHLTGTVPVNKEHLTGTLKK